MTIAATQRRLRELGRIRIGAKDERGYPTRLDVFRLTSPSKELLRAASGYWGGIPQEWVGAPGEGKQYELVTESDTLEVWVPRQDVAGKQLMELYTKAGIQRRCDGEFELRSGRACLCDPADRECTPTTHVLFMLPQLPDVGTWRLTTHGWNAAAELPATIELLLRMTAEGVEPEGTLAIEVRTSVVDGQTKHYPVPVLRVPYALADLRHGVVPVLEGGGRGGRPPITGARPELPADPSFAGELGPASIVGGGGQTVDLGVAPVDAPPPTSQSGGEAVQGFPLLPAAVDPPDPTTDAAGDEGNRLELDGVGEPDVGVEDEGSASGTDSPDSGEAFTPTDGQDERDQAEALSLLLRMVGGNLSRAAAYTNKVCGTSYKKTTIGLATFAELKQGIDEAERVMADG